MTLENLTPVFLHGLRTPFGRAGKGAFAETRPDDLLAALLTEQKKRHPGFLPDDLLVGCAYPEGEQGYNVARMAGLAAGYAVPAATYNRLCGSSLEAIAVAASRVKSGWGETFLVGGVESMSRVPRRGAGFSESSAIRAKSPDAYIQMLETAENVARRVSIGRSEQDEFSARSHELASTAFKKGFYQDQIFENPCGVRLSQDEGIRVPVDRAKMASLKPVLGDGAVVTAATSSPLSDGASSGWVTSLACAKKNGARDALKIRGIAWGHVEPSLMGLGPVPATRKLLQQESIAIDQIAAFEMNEAFAIQVLACAQDLRIPMSRLNTHGGAIAIGHPLGASGLRLISTLHARLKETGDDRALGLASLCLGGGQGLSILVEYLKL